MITEHGFTQGPPLPGFVADVSAPAAHTAAVITYPAVTGQAHVIYDIAFSYAGSGTLSGGNLQITDGTLVIFNLDVNALGTYQISFRRPKQSTVNQQMVDTLADGGANVSGKLSVSHDLRDALASPHVPMLDFSYAQNSMYL
jgi:autotransporter translocation and assembly factor TamB